MREMRQLLIGMIGMAMFVSDTGVARADKKMVVLVDLTGSMAQPRRDPTCPDPSDPSCPIDPVNPTRYDAAKSTADFVVETAAGVVTPGQELNGVRVFIFHTLDAVNGISEIVPAATAGDPNPGQPGSPGWFTATAARRAIASIAPPNGGTPLAASMCQAANVFSELNNPDTIRDLQTFTDGGENTSFTVAPPNCFPEDGDWQTAVRNHVINAGVVVSPTLYTNVAVPAPFRFPSVNPEAGFDSFAPGLAAALVSDEEFFRDLAAVTGGTFRVIRDADRPPVYADMTGDSVVTRDDAILLARKFGQPASSNAQFDLNGSGVIGFDDYSIIVPRIRPPDPFTPRDPIICRGARQIVIDGQAVENAGITIDVRGACQITIRNSLIVSGRNAITILGTAALIVDNSIIVGEDAVISQQGSAVLSAANSVFHGRLDTKGAFHFIDRGGNVFE
jgi:hypothetical protein